MSDLKSFSATPSSFGTIGAIIVPGANDLPAGTKAVLLLTAGDVTVVPEGNQNADALPLVGLPAGYILPYRVRRVTAATATCATIAD